MTTIYDFCVDPGVKIEYAKKNNAEEKKVALESDVPAGLPKEVNPAKERYFQHLKAVEEHSKGYPALVCGQCGNILQNGKCRNHCVPFNADPFIKRFHYFENPATYSELCVPVDEHGEILQFKPMKAAQVINEYFLFLTDRETKTLYCYDPELHRWVKDGETYLHKLLAASMETEYKAMHRANVLDALKAITYTDFHFSDKIAVENGLLNVRTGELSEFSPNEMAFYSLPVKYDPIATCTIWETFVSQSVAPEDVNLMQEWSGYTLLPAYVKHFFMVAYGKGRNGKGVWDRTLKGILGNENCLSLRLEELNGNNRFALARLHGKLYVCCPEPMTNHELQTPILKAITGEDELDAEIKNNQETLKFTNVGKVTVFGNRFPKVNDDTDGFYDRVQILEFPNHIAEADRVDNLEQTWLSNPAERSGILNWMLQGLQRLIANGHFTTSKTQQEKVLELKKVSDPFAAFVQEQCEFKQELQMAKAEMYRIFKDYCESIGVEPLTEKAFTQKMSKQPRVKQLSTRVFGKAERIWRGISAKPLQDEPETQQTNLPATAATDATRLSLSENASDSKKQANKTPVASVAGVAAEPYFNSCYFCQKPIWEPEAVTDDFTEHKPAHRECYDQHKAGLKLSRAD